MSQPADFTANIQRFSGFAGHYNTYRPQPPPVLLDLLTQMAQITTPHLLVDLGCGTGLSTRFWAERAKQIIGIEPTDDMRQQAAEQTNTANITYQSGFSHQTDLPDDCADIVTCSQALHWMAPQPTFEEAARILRPGGVFAAYDCDWPPTTSHWEAETAYKAFIDGVHQIEQARNLSQGLQKWAKDEHLSRMQASGCFRYIKELGVHHWEKGNAERLIGLALSQGGVATVLKHGFNESDIGLNKLKAVLDRTLGDEQKPWCWSYKVRVGIV